MQKDIAKGRGLLTILILSFSYPHISLHIMTSVTKCVVETILVPLHSDFLGDCSHSVASLRPRARAQRWGQRGSPPGQSTGWGAAGGDAERGGDPAAADPFLPRRAAGGGGTPLPPEGLPGDGAMPS